MWQTDMIDLRDPTIVQTEELCMQAVKKDGRALRCVKKQTEAICIEAVKQNGYALEFVKNQTEAICMEAVKQNGWALQYVHNQTEAIRLCAVKQNGYALEFVDNQTEAICMCAVKQNGHALKYVINQTDVICLEVIANNYIISGSPFNIYTTLIYPTPQLINIFLKLYPLNTNYIMTNYVKGLMKMYKKCGDIIKLHLVRHANDLLYRPNSVNALFCHIKWYATATNSKTIFLKS